MLLKDFYKIISLENTVDSKYKAVISINEQHDVFKGHFPGNPIMPGVCMMQIIKRADGANYWQFFVYAIIIQCEIYGID